MGRTLILGVGNLILTDDGVGIHAVKLLQESGEIHPDIQIVDGGTCGLDLLQYVAGTDKLVILDAARNSGKPGTISRITGEKVPAYLSIKTSPHEIGLPELLFAAKLSNVYPKEVVIYCVEAESLETQVGLTQAVENALPELVRRVIEEVRLN
jgi:hydrogenase maturation protease